MFTGIIQGQAIVGQLTHLEGLTRMTLVFPSGTLDQLQRGASISVNGACLTVTDFDADSVTFDIMAETLKVTNLRQLQVDSIVNFERAARFGDEIGGHLASGHVHSTAQVVSIEKSENNCTIAFKIGTPWLKYIFPKGFISINGASLTVGECITDETFCVHLIPETLSVTTFAATRPGDLVNIEIDSQTQTIVDTIERMEFKRKI